jgi:hypothetical protein
MDLARKPQGCGGGGVDDRRLRGVNQFRIRVDDVLWGNADHR